MDFKQSIFNLIILDESGSMSDIKKETLQGFNETIQSIKQAETMHPMQKQFISLVTFNGAGIKTLLFNQAASSLSELNGALYNPQHNTPLYDAMGLALVQQKEYLKSHANSYVLVTIFTDGMENASKSWSEISIKHLVEDLRAQDWTFTYIGANQDVKSAAQKIAVPNTLLYTADKEGLNAAFKTDRLSRSEYIRQRAAGMPLADNYFGQE